MRRRNARVAKEEAVEKLQVTEGHENDAKTQIISKGRSKETSLVAGAELGSVVKNNIDKTGQYSSFKHEDTEEMSKMICSVPGKSRGSKTTRAHCQESRSEPNILTEKPDLISDVKQENNAEETSKALSNGSGKNRSRRRVAGSADAQSSSKHKGLTVTTAQMLSVKVEETEEKSEAKIMNSRTTRLRKTVEVSQTQSDKFSGTDATQKLGKRKRTDTSANKRKKMKEEVKVEEDKSVEEKMVHNISEHGQQSGSACRKFVGAHTSIAGKDITFTYY